METMQDLLEKVQEFAFHDYSKEEARKVFGWDVTDILVNSSKDDEAHILIIFENRFMLFIKYFLNLDPAETDDTCELTLSLRTDLTSRIKYSINYGNYIHGQGYIRIRVADTKNRMLQMMLEEFYVPAIKNVYKPIIARFKGFYGKDFFGVEADANGSQIYYAPIRSMSEHKEARLGDVFGRLTELELLMKDPRIRQDLAKVDLQLSLLPSMMGSGI
ncbi:hypothetical protein [Methanothrix sp.]|jgi:hypothetical protein|uniref:hypothetical protein n=1 Tax=Methanothrix sp. TaxID=90426 RepID=UPI001BD6A1D4